MIHFSPFWLKKGKKDRVDALILKHLHTGRAAKVHGNFSVPEHPGHIVVIQRQDRLP